MDVQVMRGASCWTDRSMVSEDIIVYSVGVQKHPVPFTIHKFSRSGTMDEYVAALEKCDGRFSSVICAEDNWKI